MKIGVELRIDVSKVDKSRLYKGDKGNYLTMTAFIDTDKQGHYGDNGMITHKKKEGEERAPILGNATVFWKGESQEPQQKSYQQAPQQSAPDVSFDDDIPF